MFFVMLYCYTCFVIVSSLAHSSNVFGPSLHAMEEVKTKKIEKNSKKGEWKEDTFSSKIFRKYFTRTVIILGFERCNTFYFRDL